MSAPSPSKISSPEATQTSPQPSLEEQTRSNLQVIHLLTSSSFLQRASERILCSQILSLSSQGYNRRLLAQALTISKISLKILMQSHTFLTREQYQSVLSTCKDLSESSGSSSGSTSVKRKAEEELEKQSFTASPERDDTLSALSQMQNSVSEKDFLPLLLNTIWERKQNPASPVPCPNNTSKKSKHRCNLCIQVKLFLVAKQYTLTQQIEKLLEYTTKEKLSEVLMLPMFKGCVENRFLSSIQMILIVAECGIGASTGLPNQTNPVSQLGIYLSIDEVSSSGLNNPLTQIIKSLWETPVISFEESVEADSLLVSRGNVPCLLLKESLASTFANLEIRIFKGKYQVRGPREKISPWLAKFLSQATFLTLYNLIHSPLGDPFVLRDSREQKIIPWSAVVHTYSLLLSIQTRWKISVLPNKISEGAGELGFSYEKASFLFSFFHRFAVFYKLYNEGSS
ncbi:hypothetical protein [Chlamydiifrater phoenicopteri]|uniref:hypothetical protein n=1 Tax=Chlamydiifrater phoenicopteri TaxID=2681469 RepID=UPI001BCF6DCB|nr:hypothetical protein [Chlamydiifrater phoenicopteri]